MAKIKIIGRQIEEYLPAAKEGAKIFSKEQVDLVDKLAELNVSEVTAKNLVKSNEQGLI